MDAAIIERWNETVSDDDEVWVLGDLGAGFKKLAQTKGRKSLVVGNIDKLDEVIRSGIFQRVRVAEWLPGKLLLTHIPAHPAALGSCRNVHGHMHELVVSDPRYVCVSVDQTDFRPISLEKVERRLAARAA